MSQHWRYLALATLLTAIAAVAEETLWLAEFDGRPIDHIHFIGNDDVDDDRLCNALTLGEGDMFSASAIAKSREQLLDLKKFSSVEIDVLANGDAVSVTFVVKEKWHVMSVPLVAKPPRSEAACRAKASALSFSELEGMRVEAIKFTGNKRTREIVLREEILFTEGDAFSVDQLIRSRQSIKNLSLFKMVWIHAERGEQGVIVTFAVREKWYILPLPKLERNSDGDISYGGDLTWDNFLGLNHKLEIEIEEEDQADGETEQRASIDYDVPKIFGTPYAISGSIGRKRTLQEVEDDQGSVTGEQWEYLDKISVGASRWLKRISPSHGWFGGAGIQWSDNYYETASGAPQLEEDERRLNFGFNGGFTAVNDHEYYRDGSQYGAGIGFGREALGSSNDYATLRVYWRRYQPIKAPLRSNLNMQFRSGYNDGLTGVFELGGSKSLRGIEGDRQATGDAFAMFNVNWLIPTPGYPALRWNLFSDVGNAWERDDVDPFDLLFTVGGGARWKIRNLVNLSLRLDIAFDPEAGEYKIYAGTNRMF